MIQFVLSSYYNSLKYSPLEKHLLRKAIRNQRISIAQVNQDLLERNEAIQDRYHSAPGELREQVDVALGTVSKLLSGDVGALTAEQSECVGLVKESCDRIRHIVKDLRD